MTFDTKNVFTLKKDALRKFLTQYNDVETLRCLEYSKYTLDEEDKDIIKKRQEIWILELMQLIEISV